MFENDKTKEKKYCYLTESKSSSWELKSFQLLVFTTFREQVWIYRKSAASFAIAFSWLSSHYENSKSTSGYHCELKQILVDFLRAFNRGKFLPES